MAIALRSSWPSSAAAAVLLLLLLALLCTTSQAQMDMPMIGPSTVNMPETGKTNSSSSTACADVHVMVVRGSGEPVGQGIIGTLANMIAETNPGASVEAIDYPALLSPYGPSSANGTLTTVRQIMSYVDSCPKAKLILLGYSQGAHVIGDAMCGGGGPALSPYNPPLPAKYADTVVAMVQMGDPRFMAGSTFDVGTNKMMNGDFPRTMNISCDALGRRIQSYCDKGDPFCAMGADLVVHLTYTSRYNMLAHDFVTQKLKPSGKSSMNMGKGMNGGASSTGASLLGAGLALVLVLFVLGN